MKNKNLHIETLRGVACILLVAYHVVGANPNVGLKIDQGVYREINDILAYVRMPLFTFISGIVYTYRPFSGGIRPYITGKFRRILVPMFTIGTLFAVIQANTPGANSSVTNWHLLHIVPVAHFWFLEAIFLIFLILIPLEKMRLLSSKSKFACVFIASIILYLSSIQLVYFSVSGAIYLFPYFLLGMAMQRFSIIKYLNPANALLLIAGIIALLLVISFDVVDNVSKRSLIGLALGIMSCTALLSLKMLSSILANIGFYSYPIYLYHVFFTAGSRIIFFKLGVFDINLLFISSLFFGLIGPIIVTRIFDMTNFSRILFLGKGRIPSSKLISKPAP